MQTNHQLGQEELSALAVDVCIETLPRFAATRDGANALASARRTRLGG